MTKMIAGRVANAAPGQSKGETPTLDAIIKQCAQAKASWGLRQNDIMFAFAYWSMVESGFQPVPPEDAIKLRSKDQENLPKNWKHKTRHVYEAHFILPPHPDHPVKLVALPAGDILCLNVLVSNVSPKNISLKSLAVYSSGYVPRPEEDSALFSGLSEFQLLFKNLIVWPIRCSILTELGILNGSLCGLSDEIKLKIVSNLTAAEVLRLGQTCHDLHRICSDQRLWKKLFHSSFKPECQCSRGGKECEEELDWKEEFKQAYGRKQSEGTSESSPSESYYTPPEFANGSEIDFRID